jgi:arylsulfatase A-like enzyme
MAKMKTMDRNILRNILILTGSTAALAPTYAQTTRKPNIIYIMCDDMGYGDLGCYGQHYISTPCIDQMAREGMRFTQAYAGSPVSAPSRACLMTGQHSGHTWVRGNKEHWKSSPIIYYGDNADHTQVGQEPYDTAHIILPEVLKLNGYTTGMFGKWAGGYEGSTSTPKTRGIDEYFGYICQHQAHAYYPNFLNRYSPSRGDTDVVRIVLEDNIRYGMPCSDTYEQRTQYSADLIHREAMAWLEERAKHPDVPFAGLLTYTLPHAELFQPRDSLLSGYQKMFHDEKSYAGSPGTMYHYTDCAHSQFAAMITRLDAYVGEVLTFLREHGLDENTIVVFTSDNGPHEEGGADPTFFNRDGLLRGIKRSTHEGGIRIPYIVRWPGHVKAGTVNDHQLAFYDVMPTVCELIGDEGFPEKYVNPRLTHDYFDGISFAPTLLGHEGEQLRHDFLYWEVHETDMMGVRMGEWKLVVKAGECKLYNLADDLHEDNDVSALYPDIVARMKQIIRQEHTESALFRVTLP